MRKLIGFGTPRGLAEALAGLLTLILGVWLTLIRLFSRCRDDQWQENGALIGSTGDFATAC